MSNLKTTNKEFYNVIDIIESAKGRTYKKVNEELIMMYFKIGELISIEIENSRYGNLYITKLAEFFLKEYPELKGFDKRNLYKIKQFYELYHNSEEALNLMVEINWSCHRIIMSSCKTFESRIFYMSLCAKNHLSRRELERQIDSAYYERYMLSNKKLSPAIERSKNATKHIFLDNYSFDFLKMNISLMSENDLEKSIVEHMKEFILEIGKDFTFIKEEYPIQVGKHEYYIDLLFYHRVLSCLVAFELKVGEFKPEYISKMDFYLEALDRNIKKENENPSVGIILCAGKDDEVVEYSLSRTLSPTMVAEYNLKLIDKKLLAKKLKEYVSIAKSNID